MKRKLLDYVNVFRGEEKSERFWQIEALPSRTNSCSINVLSPIRMYKAIIESPAVAQTVRRGLKKRRNHCFTVVVSANNISMIPHFVFVSRMWKT